MNRSLKNVLFGGAAPAAAPSDYKIEGKITQTNVDEAAEALAGADSVILVRIVLLMAHRPSNAT